MSHLRRIIWLRIAALFLTTTPFVVGCAASRQEQSFREELRNQTFPSEWTASGHAPLSNGVYREPAASGSASEIVVRLTEHHAIGKMEGRPFAAVVIVTEPGGSGSFYNLALLQQLGDDWEVVHHVLLGDRIRIESLGFDKNSITAVLITHGPGDPMCCPTRKTSARFRIQGGQLRKTLPPEAMPLTGRIWKWRNTERADGSNTMPEHPENYTIVFAGNGQVRLLVDCNSAGGEFTVRRNRIAIDIAYSTMAACASNSLDTIFTQDILAIEAFYFQDRDLHLIFTDSAGKMIFFP